MYSHDPGGVKPTFNPEVSTHTRQRVTQLIRRAANPPDRRAIERVGWFIIICCAIGTVASGFAPAWLIGLAISASATGFMHRELTCAGLKHYRDQYITPADLDAICQPLMLRTQRAVDAVLGSEVHATGLLADAAGEADLRWHEWEIATQLRDITRLRTEHLSATCTRMPGPMTAAVLASHRLALTKAQDATTKRITALERYAAHVKAADDAQQDWRDALRAADRNPKYLDLIARTAADQHAVAELTILTDQAAAAEQAFQDSIDQAIVAAGALTFPDEN